MLIISSGKTFLLYQGDLAPGDVCLYQPSGLTVAAGIVVDIQDVPEASDPAVLVSELSNEFLTNASLGLVDLSEFLAEGLSLVDYPLARLAISDLIKIEPTPQVFSSLINFMDECSARLQSDVEFVTKFVKGFSANAD